jgi:hypothetical protein
LQTLFLLNAGGADVSLRLHLDEPGVLPFRAAAEHQYQQMLDRIRTLSLNLPEAQEVKTIRQRVLQGEQDLARCQETLSTIEVDLLAPNANVATLAKKKAEVHQELVEHAALVDRLRRELPQRVEAFRVAAIAVGSRERLEKQEQVHIQKKNLAGILQAVGNKLGDLVVTSLLEGFTGSPFLEDGLAGNLALELSPPIPAIQPTIAPQNVFDNFTGLDGGFSPARAHYSEQLKGREHGTGAAMARALAASQANAAAQQPPVVAGTAVPVLAGGKGP